MSQRTPSLGGKPRYLQRKWVVTFFGCLLIAGIVVVSQWPCLLPKEWSRKIYSAERPNPPLSVSQTDEEAIRTTVTDSQLLELHFYQNPAQFRESEIEKYWLPPRADNALAVTVESKSGLICQDSDWEEIVKGITRLKENSWHYAPDADNEATKGDSTLNLPSKAPQDRVRPSELLRSQRLEFDIQSLQLLAPDVAVVTTKEYWYMPVLDSQGLQVARNPYIGPFTADYFLVKSGQQWFIYNSTVPRYSPAIPKRVIVGMFVVGCCFVGIFLWARKRNVQPPQLPVSLDSHDL